MFHEQALEQTLLALDGHLKALGPAGLRGAIADIDLPDHLWLAVETLCLSESQRDSIVQALLRFSPLEVVEFADGSVLLHKPLTQRIAHKPPPLPDRAIEAFVRPPFRPAPARRKALRLGR